MRTYELTIEATGVPSTYREHIFEAPDDIAAVMHALRWPHANGWGQRVTISVGRCYLLSVDRWGRVETGMSTFRFVDDLTIYPDHFVNLTDQQLRDHATYTIAASREQGD